jgi:hypothetical protein
VPQPNTLPHDPHILVGWYEYSYDNDSSNLKTGVLRFKQVEEVGNPKSLFEWLLRSVKMGYMEATIMF